MKYGMPNYRDNDAEPSGQRAIDMRWTLPARFIKPGMVIATPAGNAVVESVEDHYLGETSVLIHQLRVLTFGDGVYKSTVWGFPIVRGTDESVEVVRKPLEPGDPYGRWIPMSPPGWWKDEMGSYQPLPSKAGEDLQ